MDDIFERSDLDEQDLFDEQAASDKENASDGLSDDYESDGADFYSSDYSGQDYGKRRFDGSEQAAPGYRSPGFSAYGGDDEPDAFDDDLMRTNESYASVKPEHRQYHSKYDSYRFQTPPQVSSGNGPGPKKKRSWAALLAAVLIIAAILCTVSVLAYSAVTGKSILAGLRSSLQGDSLQSRSFQQQGPKEEIVLGRPRTEAPSKNPEESADGERALTGQGAYLGITCLTMQDEYITEGYPSGVYVLEVNEGGPAYNGGLLKGDIITEFDGIALSTKEDLINALSVRSGGDQAAMKICRFIDDENGRYEQLTLFVTLGDRAEMDPSAEGEAGSALPEADGSSSTAAEDALSAVAAAEEALSAAEEAEDASGAAEDSSSAVAEAQPDTAEEAQPDTAEEAQPDTAEEGAQSAAAGLEAAEEKPSQRGGIPGADYRG